MTRFDFTMPGQPPSWNASYRITRQKGKQGQFFHTLSKSGIAERYQADLALVCRAAKPSAFKPEDRLIISYKFYLARDIDVDNILKMMNDAIARALEVDDKRFLVATPVKVTKQKDPYVIVGVFDAASWGIEVRPQ